MTYTKKITITAQTIVGIFLASSIYYWEIQLPSFLGSQTKEFTWAMAGAGIVYLASTATSFLFLLLYTPKQGGESLMGLTFWGNFLSWTIAISLNFFHSSIVGVGVMITGLIWMISVSMFTIAIIAIIATIASLKEVIDTPA